MLTGLLDIERDGLYLIIPGKGRVPILPGTEIEIRLGEHWIAGEYATGFEKGEIDEHIFQCGETSFCGLCSGMKARTGHEVRKEASNV